MSLAVSGADKEPALVTFEGPSHLVHGPTDTGKSYIVEALRFGMGSSERPRDIGVSEGYSIVSVQVLVDGTLKHTLFRSLRDGAEAAYVGWHSYPPQDQDPIDETINNLLVRWARADDRKILVKSGKLGAFSAGDARFLSLFDEIETLDKKPLVGSDPLTKMRKRATVALSLTGEDDSRAVLAVPTEQRTIAKGQAQLVEEQLRALLDSLPRTVPAPESIEFDLLRIIEELDVLSAYLEANAKELKALKDHRIRLESEHRVTEERLTALREGEARFLLLAQKYVNDTERLQSVANAAVVAASFETRPCPVCGSDLEHQATHPGLMFEEAGLRDAADAEIGKIRTLQLGLELAIEEIASDRLEASNRLRKINDELELNSNLQEGLLRPAEPKDGSTLRELAARRSHLAMLLRDVRRIEFLRQRLNDLRSRAKRRKQEIHREVTESAAILAGRILLLLGEWGVPDVQSISFREDLADISVNERSRISFGKGKRGIFLTAYIISLMEHALGKGYPHLGFIAVDSPVVTYKDPKHGSADPEEALDPMVKDRFYAWIANRDGPGQIIVLENEEPDVSLKGLLHTTEFVGYGELSGRVGFFPGVRRGN